MEQELHLFSEGQEGLCYQNELAREEIFFESARDYVLPDYQPEIRKLFSVTSALFSSGKYENGGRAECGGSVNHTLLYGDGEGKLQSLILSSDYEYAYDGGEEAEGCLLFGDERILSVTCRLSGPRRLSIRTKMGARLHMIGGKKTAFSVGDVKECEVAVLRKPISVMHTERKESEILLCESLTLPLGSPENARLLREETGIVFRDARVREDGILVRGEVLLQMLVSEGEGMPFSELLKLPFEETLYAEGISSDAGILCDGEVRSTDIRMEETASGVTATCEISLLLSATLRENKACDAATDLYLEKNDAVIAYETQAIPMHKGSTCSRFSLGGDFPAGEGEAQGALGVIDTTGRVLLTGVEPFEGGVVLSGECRVRFLLSGAPDEEGKPRLFSAEYTTPVRHEIPAYGKASDCEYEATLCLQSLSGRMDGDRLSFSAEVGYTVSAVEYTSVSVVSSATKGEPLPEQDPACFTVLYPAAGESLWSLGKRCHKMPEAIAKENGLPDSVCQNPDMPETLAGCVRIFLP